MNNGAPRDLETFEDMLAEYMDRFSAGSIRYKRTFQEQADSLWDWWRGNRNYLPQRRLIQLDRSKRNGQQVEKQETPSPIAH